MLRHREIFLMVQDKFSFHVFICAIIMKQQQKKQRKEVKGLASKTGDKRRWQEIEEEQT